MSDTGSSPAHAQSVQAFFSDGRLTSIPRRPARREQLLAHLAEELFTPGRTYSEFEVNNALRSVYDDCVALRRYLVAAGHLTRTPDGRTYHRVA